MQILCYDCNRLKVKLMFIEIATPNWINSVNIAEEISNGKD